MDTKSKTSSKIKTKTVLKSNEKTDKEKYVDQLNDIHKVAYSIAKDHLGSSFDLEKSIGFNEWNKNKNSST